MWLAEKQCILCWTKDSVVEANHFQSGRIKMFFELRYSGKNIYLWYNSEHIVYLLCSSRKNLPIIHVYSIIEKDVTGPENQELNLKTCRHTIKHFKAAYSSSSDFYVPYFKSINSHQGDYK